jgi:hypothetical protein
MACAIPNAMRRTLHSVRLGTLALGLGPMTRPLAQAVLSAPR